MPNNTRYFFRKGVPLLIKVCWKQLQLQL